MERPLHHVWRQAAAGILHHQRHVGAGRHVVQKHGRAGGKVTQFGAEADGTAPVEGIARVEHQVEQARLQLARIDNGGTRLTRDQPIQCNAGAQRGVRLVDHLVEHMVEVHQARQQRLRPPTASNWWLAAMPSPPR